MGNYNWLDEEVLYFVKDQMLTEPYVDADIVSRSSDLCRVYPLIYKLMVAWQAETDPNIKQSIYKEIESRVPVMEDYLF